MSRRTKTEAEVAQERTQAGKPALAHADKFFAYAREREGARIRRKDRPSPWTADPIIQKYRFCNVFREDDTTTAWIRENLRKPLFGQWNLVPVMCVARFINRIDMLEVLKPHLLKKGWCHECVDLLHERRNAGQPFVTGAYMIRSPFGVNKVDGLDQILMPIQSIAATGAIPPWKTLQEAHAYLTQFEYFGSFMAYEIVTDLRHTPLLNTAPDIMTWANAGPGAARGMSRVVYGEIGHFRYGSHKDQLELNQLMQELLALSQDKRYWPRQWPQWELRDVEHTLCEMDKYERVRRGEGEPKQLFRSGGVA
jgi:hypothetical protein